MRAGLLHSPLQPVIRPRSAPKTEFRPTAHVPVVAVAGTPGPGKAAVVNALLGLGTRLAESAAEPAWLVYRHGERAQAVAFEPGRREPRPIDRTVASARPPRRIEVRCPAPLLRSLTLIDTPGIGDRDATTAELVGEIAAVSAGIVVVVDGATPLDRAQLARLVTATDRARHVAFVLTPVQPYTTWQATLSANRALLRAHAPQLARAPWINALADLRRLMLTWVAPAGSEPAPRGSRTVTVSTTDDGWRAVLDQEIRSRRVGAGQRVAIDLATIHVRCVQELGSGRGCPELPYVLDRELHALSVRATRQLAEDTDAIVRRVFATVLDAPYDVEPPAAVLARIDAAARRTVDSLHGDSEDHRERALLLTTTSGVAVVTGPGTIASLSATGQPEPPGTVLAPIAIALTGPCYSMWTRRAVAGKPAESLDKKECRRWLQQALRVVEAELDRELNDRFADLHQALTLIAADAVDHGVLLA